MPDRHDLHRDLAELGRSVPVHADPALTVSVMARVDAIDRRPTGFVRRPRLAAAALIAILVAFLATPPVRAAIAEWFGFGSVQIHRGDERPGPAATPPPIRPGLSAEQAAAQVDFDVFALPALGEPTAAEVSADGRVLSLDWSAGVRLDQSSSLSYTFAKSARSVQRVSVSGRDALWFADSHDLVLLDESGARIPQTDRPAGRTLIWTVDGTTLRLEGDLTLTRALSLAESAEPLD